MSMIDRRWLCDARSSMSIIDDRWLFDSPIIDRPIAD